MRYRVGTPKKSAYRLDLATRPELHIALQARHQQGNQPNSKRRTVQQRMKYQSMRHEAQMGADELRKSQSKSFCVANRQR